MVKKKVSAQPSGTGIRCGTDSERILKQLVAAGCEKYALLGMLNDLLALLPRNGQRRPRRGRNQLYGFNDTLPGIQRKIAKIKATSRLVEELNNTRSLRLIPDLARALRQ